MEENNWDNLDWRKVNHIEVICETCKHINIKVPGEDLNCESCGNDLCVRKEGK